MVAPPHSEPVTPISPLEVADGVENPRPKDVGILGMEMYFPRRVRIHQLSFSSDQQQTF